MPFAYQLPPMPSYQTTFIDVRIAIPTFEHGIKDGIPYTKSYFTYPQIPNPSYQSF